MDFKGTIWVGNVYHKFEAMCLEVEEIIVQDTAKYVENQVQAVGNSVKRFCSDVVQDSRPDEPSPVSMLHDEYAPVCSSFKKKREEDVTGGKKDGCARELRGLDADDYDIFTSPRQSSYGGLYRRTRLGRKQGFRKEVTRPTSLTVVHIARVRNDVGTVMSSDPPPPPPPPPPGELARLIIKEECHRSDNLTVVNSVRSQDAEIQPSVASSSSVSEQKPEMLQELSGRSVEESCIIVDRDELHCVFPVREENDKHKPYKKIRDAISSRMKQNREQEYKRLASQWYVENGKECCGDNPKQIEEDQSSEESEWELL